MNQRMYSSSPHEQTSSQLQLQSSSSLSRRRRRRRRIQHGHYDQEYKVLVVLLVAAICSSSPTRTNAFMARTSSIVVMTPIRQESTTTSRITTTTSTTRRKTTSFNINVLQLSAFSESFEEPKKEFNVEKRKKQLLAIQEERVMLCQASEARRIQQHLLLALAASNVDPNKRSVNKLKAAMQLGYDSIASLDDALEDGYRARDELVTRNMGLVHYVCKGYTNKHTKLRCLSYQDLVQEGCIGLARAVDKYNVLEYNTKFSVYATYWIRAAVLRCVAQHDDVMHVPEHVHTALGKIQRAAQQLGWDLSTSVHWKEARQAKELAMAAGLTDTQLQNALRVKERRLNQAGDATKDIEGIATKERTMVAAMNQEQHDLLMRSLEQFLRPLELEALSWRYGLKEIMLREKQQQQQNQKQQKDTLLIRGKQGEAMAFVEVAKRMEISKEYGRRLCAQAIQKLKLAADEGRLEPDLFYSFSI